LPLLAPHAPGLTGALTSEEDFDLRLSVWRTLPQTKPNSTSPPLLYAETPQGRRTKPFQRQPRNVRRLPPHSMSPLPHPPPRRLPRRYKDLVCPLIYERGNGCPMDHREGHGLNRANIDWLRVCFDRGRRLFCHEIDQRSIRCRGMVIYICPCRHLLSHGSQGRFRNLIDSFLSSKKNSSCQNRLCKLAPYTLVQSRNTFLLDDSEDTIE